MIEFNLSMVLGIYDDALFVDHSQWVALQLAQFKPHEQEWGFKEYHNGENINNIIDSITIYNGNIKDNRFSNILARHNPNYRNILNFTSKIIHDTLVEYEELKAPKPSNRKLQKARREWSIQEPPYSRILVDNNRVRVIRVTRVDDTDNAAEITNDMSHKSKWCTVNTDKADRYLKKDDLYFILLDGERYLCHVESEQLMDFWNEPFRLSEDQYYLLSEYVPDIGLFIKDEHSEIYKSVAIKYPRTAYRYAFNVLGNNRWPEAEPVIMKDAWAACEYACYILKRKWPEAEQFIAKDLAIAYRYTIDVLEGKRWPEAEPTIMKDPRTAYHYAYYVLMRRWPEAEPTIMIDPEAAYEYAHNVLKCERWPEAEPAIMKNPRTAYMYTRNILKRRWPEAEQNIFDSYYADDYRKLFSSVTEPGGSNRWSAPATGRRGPGGSSHQI